jgi:hypothetical protein
MLGLNGRDSEVDVFAFHLALRLGKTVGELDDMPNAEYVAWQSYFTAKHAVESVQAGGGAL